MRNSPKRSEATPPFSLPPPPPPTDSPTRVLSAGIPSSPLPSFPPSLFCYSSSSSSFFSFVVLSSYQLLLLLLFLLIFFFSFLLLHFLLLLRPQTSSPLPLPPASSRLPPPPTILLPHHLHIHLIVNPLVNESTDREGESDSEQSPHRTLAREPRVRGPSKHKYLGKGVSGSAPVRPDDTGEVRGCARSLTYTCRGVDTGTWRYTHELNVYKPKA